MSSKKSCRPVQCLKVDVVHRNKLSYSDITFSNMNFIYVGY